GRGGEDGPGLGIAAATAPANTAAAEDAVTTAARLLRRLPAADAEIKRGNYATVRARLIADNLPGLEGLTAGIVGFGVIGRAVAAAFHGAGGRIAYHDPGPVDAAAAAALNATSLGLDALLQQADVVSLDGPLLPSTTGLIGSRELALMKPAAVLIQAARGGVVDEAALAIALKAGRLAGAAVDVYSSEPPAADNPLLSLDGEAAQRLLLTPHIAGITRQSS